jgi:hypothetical protein
MDFEETAGTNCSPAIDRQPAADTKDSYSRHLVGSKGKDSSLGLAASYASFG